MEVYQQGEEADGPGRYEHDHHKDKHAHHQDEHDHHQDEHDHQHGNLQQTDPIDQDAAGRRGGRFQKRHQANHIS